MGGKKPSMWQTHLSYFLTSSDTSTPKTTESLNNVCKLILCSPDSIL